MPAEATDSKSLSGTATDNIPLAISPSTAPATRYILGGEGTSALQRRLQRYCAPHVLAIDEVGYLSYDNRHADLLFEVITRRYGAKSVLITTNKPFAAWNEVFPNAACVVTLIDPLVHHAEIVQIDGNSYRLKEAKEEAARKAKERAGRAART